MSNTKGSKICVVGAGAVGATITFALTFQQLASEIVLIDVNKDKAQGEALDISRYALKASLGMRKTAWEARRGAPQSDLTWNRRSEYETSGGGQMDRVRPTCSETDLDNWYFSDDDSS